MKWRDMLADLVPRVVVAALAARVALDVPSSPAPVATSLSVVLLVLIAAWPDPDEVGRGE